MFFFNERIKCCFLGEKLLWGKNTISKKNHFLSINISLKNILENFQTDFELQDLFLIVQCLKNFISINHTSFSTFFKNF
jgi:hypothetical protein